MLSVSDDVRAVGHDDEAGFSLVESIAALAILALAATAFQIGLGVGSGALRTVDKNRAALALAKTELEKAGLGFPLEDGRRSGQSPDGFEWVVEQRAQATRQGRRTIPYWVTVTVSWTDPGCPEPRKLTLSSVRLRRGS